MNHMREIADAMAEDHREAQRHARASINVNTGPRFDVDAPPHDPDFYARMADAPFDPPRPWVTARQEHNPYERQGAARMLGRLILLMAILAVLAGAFSIAKKHIDGSAAAMLECPTPRC